jgi:threonine dehydrogenase-like Zn-dependent dehydrogenase
MPHFNMLTNRLGRVVEPGKVDFISREVPQPGPGQVLIKIVSSSICGSDLHIFKVKHPSAAETARVRWRWSIFRP